MKHPERIEDYIEHIIEAAARAIEYASIEKDQESFLKNQMIQDAIIRNIEIMGEAVSKIQKWDEEFSKAYPLVPWAKIRNMRNLLIHDYLQVNSEIIWKTVKEDLPPLRQSLIELLQSRSVKNP